MKLQTGLRIMLQLLPEALFRIAFFYFFPLHAFSFVTDESNCPPKQGRGRPVFPRTVWNILKKVFYYLT